MDIKTLIKDELDLEITDEKADSFDTFRRELVEWSDKFNLTAIREPEDINIKHFLDSLTLLPFIPKDTKTLADIGTGAGFPGIPIAIIRPEIQVTLIESIGKKCKFLEHIKEILSLENIEIVNARAEDVGKHIDYKNKFDIVTARAVTKIVDLVSYSIPLLKSKGILLAQKGIIESIKSEESNIKLNGGQILEIKKIETKNLKERVVVVIKKIP